MWLLPLLRTGGGLLRGGTLLSLGATSIAHLYVR
jgi:hypothetical protein